MPDKDTLYCSFCGKSQHEVRKLIAGPTTFICDECVDLCKDILVAEQQDPVPMSGDPPPSLEQIVTSLKQTGKIERRVLDVLAVILRRHCERMAASSSGQGQAPAPLHGLIFGPSMMRSAIARVLLAQLPVPFVLADAPTLVEVQDEVDRRVALRGEVDIREAIAYKLLKVSDFNSERAGRGIVYVDDLDQIGHLAGDRSERRGGSCEKIQRALASLMTGPSVAANHMHGAPSGGLVQVDMSGVTFLCGGSFFALTRSLDAKAWRAAQDRDPGALGDELSAALVDCGLLPELVGRLSLVAALEAAEPSD